MLFFLIYDRKQTEAVSRTFSTDWTPSRQMKMTHITNLELNVELSQVRIQLWTIWSDLRLRWAYSILLGVLNGCSYLISSIPVNSRQYTRWLLLLPLKCFIYVWEQHQNVLCSISAILFTRNPVLQCLEGLAHMNNMWVSPSNNSTHSLVHRKPRSQLQIIPIQHLTQSQVQGHFRRRSSMPLEKLHYVELNISSS